MEFPGSFHPLSLVICCVHLVFIFFLLPLVSLLITMFYCFSLSSYFYFYFIFMNGSSSCVQGIPVITTFAWTMCKKKIVTPPLHFDHLWTQVTKFLHCSQDSESAEILAIFWGVKLPRTCLSWRAQQIEVFCWSLFWNLNFSISKVFIFSNFWSFWDMIKNMCPYFLWTNNSYFICGQASMLNFDIKTKVTFELQNVKNLFFPPYIFLTIKK